MAITTSADIQNGEYGKITYDKNNNPHFHPLGKAVNVDEIIENIETQDVQLRLSFELRDGTKKTVLVNREELGDNKIITTLARKGADVTKKHADIFVDTLRLQEEEIEATGKGITRVYSHLGWMRVPYYDDTGQVVSTKLCYRADKLIGGVTARYDGPYRVKPMGSFPVWKDMIIADVVGKGATEFALIAGLSAGVVGLLSLEIPIENPITHLCLPSGKGKSTTGSLLVSVSGQPFDGQKIERSRNGSIHKKVSLYQSWGATENAVVTSMAGNHGAVVVLNELGKLKKNADVDRIIYDLSEGSDKKRLNGNMEAEQSDSFSTAIISLGETSLLERCKSKVEGLHIRVMEVDKPLTENAEHARRIKETCRANNGFAAPMMAKYIIENGGSDFVLGIYKDYCATLPEKFPDTPSKERFIEKFAALLMTTAKIATAALGIPFDTDGLLAFLIEHEKEKGSERNTAAKSYEVVIEECQVNIGNFYRTNHSDPIRDAWGSVKYPKNSSHNGKKVLEEYSIRKTVLANILSKHHFPNRDTCIKAWKEMGVLSHDSDRSTRSRKIDPDSVGTEDVYVLLLLEKDTPDWVAECENLPVEPLYEQEGLPL